MLKVIESLKESWGKIGEINLVENLKTIFSQPLGIAGLVALTIILIVLIRSKKIKLDANLISKIAIMVALSTVLDLFKIYRMPQGGSVTLGSMAPIILISLWYGTEVGLLTGLIFGTISLVLGASVIHPIQFLLDYPLAFLALGTAGLFKNNKYIGTVVAVTLRFICHVISGVVFFASYAEGSGHTPLIYSIIYNGSFLGVDALICIFVLALLPVDRLIRYSKPS